MLWLNRRLLPVAVLATVAIAGCLGQPTTPDVSATDTTSDHDRIWWNSSSTVKVQTRGDPIESETGMGRESGPMEDFWTPTDHGYLLQINLSAPDGVDARTIWWPKGCHGSQHDPMCRVTLRVHGGGYNQTTILAPSTAWEYRFDRTDWGVEKREFAIGWDYSGYGLQNVRPLG